MTNESDDVERFLNEIVPTDPAAIKALRSTDPEHLLAWFSRILESDHAGADWLARAASNSLERFRQTVIADIEQCLKTKGGDAAKQELANRITESAALQLRHGMLFGIGVAKGKIGGPRERPQ